MFRIGHSYDTHRIGPHRLFKLGGVPIPWNRGLIGHSDADVVLHVVAESIIGALALGDLGTFFPDTDSQYKNRDSSFFVAEAVKIMEERGYTIQNIDITVYLEEPMLVPYKPLMKKQIAALLKTAENNVNIKATRGEGLGYIGRREGMSAEAVVLLISNPQMKKL